MPAPLEPLWRDLRYGARQLKQSPGFTAVAILSLALGIGANTAIFQLLDAVRLRTLPVQNPQGLAYIDFAPGSQRSGWFSTRSARMTWALWKEIRAQQQAFSGVVGWSAARFNLASGGEARYAEGMYVSADFFRHLGVPLLLGRAFGPDEDGEACGAPGAVLNYAFWRREFGGDTGVLGRNITLDGNSFSIIGVTGPSFFGVEVGRLYDVAIPFCADRLMAANKKGRIPNRDAWWLSMMGRLKPGWTLDKASAQIQSIAPAVMQATLPPSYKPDMAKRYLANKLVLSAGATGISGLRRQYEQPLWLLLATTGLVLLIACANLANLLLARASVREREIAVRTALGASRGRLVRQLLSESLLLAVAGAAFGAALAQAMSRGLIAFLSTSSNPVFVNIGVDARIFGFTSLLALATCVLFGLLPAMRATRIAPWAAIRSGGRGTTAGRERFGLRRALVSTQVALSLVLLVGALLFIRSLQKLATADAGFRAEGVLTVNANFPSVQYTKERLPMVHRELLDKLSTVPGILSAAQVNFTPVSGSSWDNSIGPDGTVAAASGKESWFNQCGPGYFKTLGTPLLAGRDFNDADTLKSPAVAIVNEEFAKKFFGGANPVGRTFRREAPAGKPEPLYQIVGLVKNTKYYELREDPRPIGFFAISQNDDPGFGATFVLRMAGPVRDTLANVKTTVANVNPTIGLQFRFLSRQLEESLLRERLMATLSGCFGLLAALLATIGLYGVISFTVARRRNEIGVRMALGAGRGRIVSMVLREAAILIAVGLVAGGLLALLAGRTASSLLYGLQPHDPPTIAVAMALLTLVALIASYWPARRAAALDPMAALRDE